MKGFFAALILLFLSAFFFTSLPDDILRFLHEASIPKDAGGRIMALLSRRVFPKRNASEERAHLIREIEQAIGSAQSEMYAVSDAGKKVNKTNATSASAATIHNEHMEEFLNKAENLLRELYAKNNDEGMVKNAAARIFDAALSSQNTCEPEPKK